jgi:serine/threonine-protein kinase
MTDESKRTFVGPPPRAADPLVGARLGDKYEVRAILGRGGMATVYEARHLALDKPVAVKVMQTGSAEGDEIAAARFYQEARHAGSLGHPGICEVYDFGLLPDGRPYLVMERLTGRTLRSHLAEHGPMREGDAIDVALQVLSALAAAHEHGVVHRDVKPDNVFLAQHGGGLEMVKLLDFGVAKALRDLSSSSDEGLTSTGHVVGTLSYMAPEQLGGGAVDGRADLYSLAVVLFECLTGQRPFERASQQAMVSAIVLDPAPSPLAKRDGLGPEVCAVVLRGLVKDPALRYESAQQMIDDLRIARGPTGTFELTGPRSLPRSGAVVPERSTAARRDEQFRHLVAAFGEFSTAFNLAQRDGDISAEESVRLRDALADLERWSKLMRSELARAVDPTEIVRDPDQDERDDSG